MAAASNESFGLKIATAFAIALSVVLLVSVYFLNSNYNIEFEKRTAADKKVGELNGANRTLAEQATNFRTALGYGPVEDADAATAAMKKDDDQLKAEVQAINTEVGAMISDFQKKAGAKNIDVAQFDALKERTREVVESYLNNPDQSKKAAAARLKDLLTNQVKLATTLALNYADLRRNLDQANKVNADATKIVETSLANARAELDATIKKDEDARAELVAGNRSKSEELANLETKLTNFINDSTTKSENKDKAIAQMRSVLRDLRSSLSQTEEVMSKPGGRVTFVDYGSKTCRVSVNRNQGVRALMQFTIFDKNAAGITSDRPKALVELIKVGDPSRGENDSQARIVKTYDQNDPIRYNDFIFSAGWSYDHPQRYALVGKLDINRDGKDDRADLIRMIEAAGGIVEFDLSPPNVDRTIGQAAVSRAFARLGQPVPATTGRASGKISGLAFAYVIDRRSSTVLFAKRESEPTKDDTLFLEEESKAIKDATDQAVRPLPLEKLLNMLGYDYSMPIEGRREAIDKTSIQDLLKKKPNPRPSTPTPTPSGNEPPSTR